MKEWMLAGAVVVALIVISLLVTHIIRVYAKKTGKHIPYGPYEALFKRPLDFVISLLLLVVFCPIFLLLFILVSIKLGRPAVFKQERPGRIDSKTGKEKIFTLYKFRSMTNETDAGGNLLPDEERMTRFGNAIRSLSLDELGEFVNILKGDMSFIGPRPLLVKYLPWYTEEQRHRHDVRPGLTGYAQAHGRNAISWDEKFELDLKYVSNITFIGDLKIILDTVKAVLKREGISSETSATMESFIDYCKSQGRKPTE